MKPKSFNPDKLHSPGKGYRFMRMGELIPNRFEHWSNEANQWRVVRLYGDTQVYLDSKCASTRRLPKSTPVILRNANV